MPQVYLCNKVGSTSTSLVAANRRCHIYDMNTDSSWKVFTLDHGNELDKRCGTCKAHDQRLEWQHPCTRNANVEHQLWKWNLPMPLLSSEVTIVPALCRPRCNYEDGKLWLCSHEIICFWLRLKGGFAGIVCVHAGPLHGARKGKSSERCWQSEAMCPLTSCKLGCACFMLCNDKLAQMQLDWTWNLSNCSN